jgi:adenine-specific DNA-methyltransferase
MVELNFKGKEFVYNHHLAVPHRPLVPHSEKGIEPVSLDGNLIIQGDNLHALKALLPLYAGKVDCIFIDPPNNTGSESWAYNDNVNAPMIREWLDANPIGIEDGLRHDKWCAMMFPRVRILRELLSENGSIWITLDHNEQHHFHSILIEIFGKENYVSTISWHARESVQNDTDISNNNVNYVIVFAKNRRKTDRRLKKSNSANWFTEPTFAVRPLDLDLNRYSNPDNDPRGDWKLDPFDAPGVRKNNLSYKISNPNTGRDFYPPAGRHWGTEEKNFQKLLADNRVLFGRSGRGRPGIKIFASEKMEFGEVEINWWDGPATTTDGVKELRFILPNNNFDNPKPTALVTKIIKHAVGASAIILDSFAGSGTTAHAVLKANKDDGGNRKFILVEMEDYADNLTAERVRRVIKGYKFKSTQKTELLRKSLTWHTLKNANSLVDEVEGIENLHGHEFDRIQKEIKNKELIVTGEKDCSETANGLGGTFTYCTLGEPVDLDRILSGETLPAYEALGTVLFHMATSQPIDPAAIKQDTFYLGECNGQKLWLIYKPDLDWLKSSDAALTLARAREFAVSDQDKTHLVFAPARFVSQKILNDHGLKVEFVPLPFALYRIERS